MQITLRFRSRVLPICLAIVAGMQLLDPSRVWVTLGAALAGIWLVAYLWVSSASRHLRLRREMRFGWAQVGDKMEERFTLENHGPLPVLWVEVLDLSDVPGYNASQVSDVGAQSRRQWMTSGVCERRGMFTLGPTSLHTSDPFGLYDLEIHYSAAASLLVMPPIVPLPSIEVAPGGRTGDGRPRPNAPERTVSSAGVREYLPGDSLHSIHWPTTARLGTPFVRIFDGTPAGDWWIFLDLQEGVQAGQGWESTVEHGIVLTASLADRGLRLGRSVGLAANGRPLTWLPPRRSETQRSAILRALALVEPGSYSLAELLLSNRAQIGQRSSLVIITANTHGDWVQPLLSLAWKGSTPTVLLFDPRTFGGSGEAPRVAALLNEWNIATHLIPRSLLDRPEAHPGQQGHWLWHVSATGRALPVRRPADLSWKVIS